MTIANVEGVVDVADVEEDCLRRPRIMKFILWMFLALGFGIIMRAYQQYFAWSCTESTAPCYARVWMPWLYVSLTTYVVVGSAWYAWLAKGCKTCDAQREAFGEVTPRHESSHLWTLMGIILVLGVAVYWGGSYFAEEDGSWHQIAVRDTAFTPAHIIIFYTAFPMFVLFGIGGYLYGRTRIPVVFRDRGFPLSWGLIIAAVLMEMMQIAWNEWSHSFWIAEEIFSAPFHWGFTAWAYMAAGAFAVWAQIFGRAFELLPRTGSGQGGWNGRSWILTKPVEEPATETVSS